MRKLKERIILERQTKELEQYDYSYSEEIFKKEKEYAKSIGSFLISFSNLESSLDHMIAQSMSDRSDEAGFRILKYLEFGQKISFAQDHYRRWVGFIENKKTKEKEKDKLKIIIDKLVEISEFRNKVAHANWMTLDEKGFVRVDIKEDKNEGGIILRSVKMTPGVITKFTRQADALATRIDIFKEEIGQKI